jgi:formiminotetrahydrofolate cyclodeaminase
MRDETISGFLRQLAARTSAPGGGATAALHAAQAAALIAMVARFSDGPHSDVEVVKRVLPVADALVDEALDLAEADAAAFGKVIEAYRLPRQTTAEQQARSEAIAQALGGAARPPADLLVLSARLITLAEELLPTANRNLIGDLLAATASVRAAAEISRVNLEANLSGIQGSLPDQSDAAKQELTAALVAAVSSAAGIIVRAEHLAAEVREALAPRP